uniref:Uncharacterized protein n=1 Tax=Cannabis sativa TaxID=3483 RepID=A0A803Q1N0_CANSA
MGNGGGGGGSSHRLFYCQYYPLKFYTSQALGYKMLLARAVMLEDELITVEAIGSYATRFIGTTADGRSTSRPLLA